MNASAGARPRICAVIVTYFPGAAVSESLAALAPQVSEILIVDNGSPPELLARLTAATAAVGATLIPLSCNRGVAHALNVGLEFARARDCQWLATFDQDSRAAASMIDVMLAALERYPQPPRIAMLTPVHVERRLGVSLRETSEVEGPGWRVLYTAMTSGNLVDVTAATAVGGFEDSFFIDYVDHEFCLRLRRHGYRVLEATEARLLHSLGDISAHRLGSRPLLVTNHSATRRYYMSRNRLILWWRYFRSESHWVRHDMRSFAAELIGILLYESECLMKLRMIARGSLDAVRGVRGPLKSVS
jgi:rhamnosyltransferase